MNSKIIFKFQMKLSAESICFEGFNSCVHHCAYFAYSHIRKSCNDSCASSASDNQQNFLHAAYNTTILVVGLV